MSGGGGGDVCGETHPASDVTDGCHATLPPLAGWSQAAEVALVRTASSSLYARLRSIEWDARRALALRESIAPHLPLYGNVRAGAWYVPPSARRSFFKSADGHYAHWNVSPRRPNIPLLRGAVHAGGAVVVDVTRAGKAWPDALSKALPLWCAVISAVAAGFGAGAGDSDRLQALLHLHPSVPPSEDAAIRRLLPGIVQMWRDAGVDLRALVPELFGADGGGAATVRPLWVRADAESLWEDGVPSAARLGFVPIVCLSASPPLPAGRRAFVEADAPALDAGEACPAVAGVPFPPRDVGFAYVQGAGDDEEAWCQGLSPAVFWNNRCAVLAFARERQNAAAGDARVRLEMAELLKTFRSCGRGEARAGAAAQGGILAAARVRVVASNPASICDDVRLLSSASSPSAPVLVLSHSQRRGSRGDSVQQKEADGPAAGGEHVHWFDMTDSRGKPDRKLALHRALGLCLAILRRSLAGAATTSAPRGATILCDSGDGDWAAGVALAWIAWHCSPDLAGVCAEPPDRGVGKAMLQQLLLRVAAERADLVVSRRTAQQLNMYFHGRRSAPGAAHYR
jgi:hypothetical protein